MKTANQKKQCVSTCQNHTKTTSSAFKGVLSTCCGRPHLIKQRATSTNLLEAFSFLVSSSKCRVHIHTVPSLSHSCAKRMWVLIFQSVSHRWMSWVSQSSHAHFTIRRETHTQCAHDVGSVGTAMSDSLDVTRVSVQYENCKRSLHFCGNYYIICSYM